MALAEMRAIAWGFSVVIVVLTFSTSLVSAGDEDLWPGENVTRIVAMSEDVNVDTLTDDLWSTDAVGFVTKLELKSKFDVLLADFYQFHEGSSSQDIQALYARFDRLLKTTLDLLAEGDPALFLRLKRSRITLWHTLSDRQEFYAVAGKTDIAWFKDSDGR